MVQLSLSWPHEGGTFLLANCGLILANQSVHITKLRAAIDVFFCRGAQALLQIPGPGSVEGDSLNGCDALVTTFVSIFVIHFATTLRCTMSSSELSSGLSITQGHPKDVDAP